ncbi:hypothetical protein [Haladaptatus caseinilyticus]|uniref:hypothetical protein n=1 Tax=Haladaptatus caseinilyticus TaxID=2993314 RepID=UPI00224B78E9|nr:hypothetical protein [Haladaptatus caseinilyticus]
MTQRTRTRETSDDLSDILGDESGEQGGGSESFRSRTKQRAVNFFSPRYFLLAVVALTVSTFVGGFVPFVGTLGGLVGMFVAAFALGGLTSESRTLETATGGLVAAGLTLLLGNLTLLAAGGTTVAAVGLGAGFLVAGLGAYFGSDLRDGLTRDL